MSTVLWSRGSADLATHVNHLVDTLKLALNDTTRGSQFVDRHVELYNLRLSQLKEGLEKDRIARFRVVAGERSPLQTAHATTRAERDTWVLLRHIREVEDAVAATQAFASSDAMAPEFQDRFSMRRIAERTLRSSPDLQRGLALVKWLEETADPFIIDRTDLLFKRTIAKIAAMKHGGNSSSVNLLTSVLRANDTSSSAAESNNQSFLDPDAVSRPHGGNVLDKLDIEEEKVMLTYVWRLIRSGHLDQAIDLCAAFQLHWRAASLAGGLLPHDATDAFANQTKQQQQQQQHNLHHRQQQRKTESILATFTSIFANFDALSSPFSPSSAGAAALAQKFKTGNSRYFLWKSQCRAIASFESVTSVTSIERAVYGILGGDVTSALGVCSSWQDVLWVHLKIMLAQAVDQAIIQACASFNLPKPATCSAFSKETLHALSSAAAAAASSSHSSSHSSSSSSVLPLSFDQVKLRPLVSYADAPLDFSSSSPSPSSSLSSSSHPSAPYWVDDVSAAVDAIINEQAQRGLPLSSLSTAANAPSKAWDTDADDVDVDKMTSSPSRLITADPQGPFAGATFDPSIATIKAVFDKVRQITSSGSHIATSSAVTPVTDTQTAAVTPLTPPPFLRFYVDLQEMIALGNYNAIDAALVKAVTDKSQTSFSSSSSSSTAVTIHGQGISNSTGSSDSTYTSIEAFAVHVYLYLHPLCPSQTPLTKEGETLVTAVTAVLESQHLYEELLHYAQLLAPAMQVHTVAKALSMLGTAEQKPLLAVASHIPYLARSVLDITKSLVGSTFVTSQHSHGQSQSVTALVPQSATKNRSAGVAPVSLSSTSSSSAVNFIPSTPAFGNKMVGRRGPMAGLAGATTTTATATGAATGAGTMGRGVGGQRGAGIAFAGYGHMAETPAQSASAAQTTASLVPPASVTKNRVTAVPNTIGRTAQKSRGRFVAPVDDDDDDEEEEEGEQENKNEEEKSRGSGLRLHQIGTLAGTHKSSTTAAAAVANGGGHALPHVDDEIEAISTRWAEQFGNRTRGDGDGMDDNSNNNSNSYDAAAGVDEDSHAMASSLAYSSSLAVQAAFSESPLIADQNTVTSEDRDCIAAVDCFSVQRTESRYLLEALLHVNCLFRRFAYEGNLAAGIMLLSHTEDIAVAAEEVLGESVTALLRPDLHHNVSHGGLSGEDGDAAATTEANGNAMREFVAWRLYLNAMVQYEAWRAHKLTRPEPVAAKDVAVSLAASGEVEGTSATATATATATAALMKQLQSEYHAWLQEDQALAEVFFEAVETTLLLEGGFLVDLVHPTSNVAISVDRKTEVAAVRSRCVSLLILLLARVCKESNLQGLAARLSVIIADGEAELYNVMTAEELECAVKQIAVTMQEALLIQG